jgi:hypothetical protein
VSHANDTSTITCTKHTRTFVTHNVVERDRVDCAEARHVVFVGRIVAVPRDDVKRRVLQLRLEQRACQE